MISIVKAVEPPPRKYAGGRLRRPELQTERACLLFLFLGSYYSTTEPKQYTLVSQGSRNSLATVGLRGFAYRVLAMALVSSHKCIVLCVFVPSQGLLIFRLPK